MDLALRQHVKVLEADLASATEEKANIVALYRVAVVAALILGLCAGVVVPI